MASTSNFKEFFFWSPQSKDCCFIGKWYYTGKIIIKFWFSGNNSGELTLTFKTNDELKCIEHLTEIQKEIEKHGSVMAWCGHDLQSGKTKYGKM